MALIGAPRGSLSHHSFMTFVIEWSSGSQPSSGNVRWLASLLATRRQEDLTLVCKPWYGRPKPVAIWTAMTASVVQTMPSSCPVPAALTNCGQKQIGAQCSIAYRQLIVDCDSLLAPTQKQSAL